MQQILQAINNSGFTAIEQGAHVVASWSVANLSAINPLDFTIRVEEGAVANVVLLNGSDSPCSIAIDLKRGAKLNLTQLLVGTATINVDVHHGEDAASKIVAVSLSCNTLTYNVQLCGINGYSELDTLQLTGEKDNNSLKINMGHLSPSCSSRSLSKCVASGESNIKFDGMVYVAHDAQHTAAEQNCRSIELSDTSHIVAQPQLEIYADDVKCSHGATMGQVDTDAILYMRQRGLSEAQARRLQIEGFIADVVGKCNIEAVCAALGDTVNQKLHQL